MRLSYVFAEYAADLFQMPPDTTVWFALAAVSVLTLLNMVGVNAGRHTQKVLVVAKLLGLALLIGAGLSAKSPSMLVVTNPIHGPGWSLAMILVLVCLWRLERCRRSSRPRFAIAAATFRERCCSAWA